MNKPIKSTEQLKGIIEYILWSYDVNNSTIADKSPEVFIEDYNSFYIVTITYISEIVKGCVKSNDPQINDEDETRTTDFKFNLLKTEKFKQLTKYVEDICDEIAKVTLVGRSRTA